MNKTISSKEYQECEQDQGRREKHQGAAWNPLGGNREGRHYRDRRGADRIRAGEAGDGGG